MRKRDAVRLRADLEILKNYQQAMRRRTPVLRKEILQAVVRQILRMAEAK